MSRAIRYKGIDVHEQRYFDELVELIKNSENATILRFYGYSFTRLLQKISYKEVLMPDFSKLDLDKHIFLFYDCDYGEDIFKEVLDASLSRFSDKPGFPSKIYDLVEKDYKVTFICDNFKFEYK